MGVAVVSLTLASLRRLRIDLVGLVDRVDGRIDRLDERFTRLDERFDRLDERFDRLDERIARIETGQGDLRERMAHLEGLLDGLREAIVRNQAA